MSSAKKFDSLWMTTALIITPLILQAPFAQATEQTTGAVGTIAAAAAVDPNKTPASPDVSSNASVSSAPLVRNTQISFKQLGLQQPLKLRGVDGSAGLELGLRLDELVEAAQLRLNYTVSPSLLPAVSHIRVLLNGEILHTIAIDKDKLGSPQITQLNLDARFFTDFNRLRFQLIGHYTNDCENPHHSSLWADISPESTLILQMRQLPLRNDLSLLPAPFFDARDHRTVGFSMVFADQPSLGLLRASGSLASWMGVLASYRGVQFSSYHNQLPSNHAVVFATNSSRPAFLNDEIAKGIFPVTQPTLRMMNHPSAKGQKLLLILGQDDAQVQQATDAWIMGQAALSGESIQISNLQPPPKRKPYDAPRWISSERVVPLAELVQYPSELQLRGTTLSQNINITTRMAPDLFTWNAPGVPLNLHYRYTPTHLSHRGALNLAINDQFIQSLPLHSSDNVETEQGKAKVLLPLFDDNSLQAKSEVKIPAFLIGGNNQLQFSFQLPPPELDRCQATPPPELRAAIDASSTIDLGGFYHYLAMPNLAAFANSGFPFTRLADLSETAVVLPAKPTNNELILYWNTLARMGAATGYPATRFKLLNPAQINQADGHDILLLGSANADPTFQSWKNALPALVEAGERSIRPLQRNLDNLFDLFNLETGFHPNHAQGQAVLQGNGALAAIRGFASPLNSKKERSVVSLLATDDASLMLIDKGLSDGAQINQMRGDLSLFRGDKVASFRTHPVYYVGDLPWWRQLWFSLHNHPLLLATTGILSGFIATLMAFLALKARARKRLNAGRK